MWLGPGATWNLWSAKVTDPPRPFVARASLNLGGPGPSGSTTSVWSSSVWRYIKILRKHECFSTSTSWKQHVFSWWKHIKFLIHPPGSNMFHVPTMCISYIPTVCGAGARLHVPIWRGSGARSPGWPSWEGPGWKSWGIPSHHGLGFDSHWSHQGHHGWAMTSIWFFWGSPKMEGFWKTSDGSVQWSFHGSY